MRRLAPLLGVAILAACGSGSDSGLSHADLVTKADAICAKAHKAEEGVPTPTKASLLPAYDAALPIARTELRELRALKPGKDDAAGFAAVVAGLQKTIALTQRTRDALAANKTLRANVLIQLSIRAGSDAQATAAGFGLEICSKSL